MTRHSCKWAILLFLLLGLGLSTPGCSDADADADSDGASTSTADLDGLREEVAEARAAADSAGAMRFAGDTYKDAEKWLSKGEEKQKSSYFRRSIKYFNTATTSALKVKEKLADVIAIQTEYEGLRKKAEEAGGKTLVKREFDEAEATFAKALKRMESGKKISSARREMKMARSDMQRVIERIDAAKLDKSGAEAAKTAMVSMKARAIEAKAERFAVSDLEFGKGQEADADQAYAGAEFKKAKRLYGDAKISFTYALENALRVADGNQPVANGSGGLADSGFNPGGRDSSGAAPKVDRPVRPMGDGEGVGIDLIGDVTRLFQGSATLDGEYLVLSYDEGDGPLLQKDSGQSGGKLGKHIIFKGDTGVGVIDYVLAGNTAGMVLIRAGFKEQVKFKAQVNFQMFAPSPTRYFEMMLNSNAAGTSYYGVQMGNRGLVAITYKDGNPKSGSVSVIGEHKKDANRWLSRRESHTFVVTVAPNDKGQQYLTVEFDGVDCIRMKAKSLTKGFVGFRWKDTKFFITNMKVKGKLDEDWAKKAIASDKRRGGGGGDDGGGDDLDF